MGQVAYGKSAPLVTGIDEYITAPIAIAGRAIPGSAHLVVDRDVSEKYEVLPPLRVHDRLKPSPARHRLGKRVSVPMRSAANWSSEIVLRKPPRAGCGAAVKKQMSAGCPPSQSGCHTPLKTVKSLRCSCSVSR